MRAVAASLADLYLDDGSGNAYFGSPTFCGGAKAGLNLECPREPKVPRFDSDLEGAALHMIGGRCSKRRLFETDNSYMTLVEQKVVLACSRPGRKYYDIF